MAADGVVPVVSEMQRFNIHSAHSEPVPTHMSVDRLHCAPHSAASWSGLQQQHNHTTPLYYYSTANYPTVLSVTAPLAPSSPRQPNAVATHQQQLHWQLAFTKAR
jgi:hypothetical protein